MRWRKRIPDPPGPTGGREAREQAEQALHEARKRKLSTEPLRLWLRSEAVENHFGRDVQTIIDGRRA